MQSRTHPPQPHSKRPASARQPNAPGADAPQALSANAPLNPNNLLQLQRLAGNRVVNRLLAKPPASVQRPLQRTPPSVAPTRLAVPHIQRLPEKDVREKFNDIGLENFKKEIIDLIVKLTTEFENSLEHGGLKFQAKKTLLDKLETHLMLLSADIDSISSDEKYWTELVNKWIEPLDPKAQEKKKKTLQKQNLEKAMELISNYKNQEDLPAILPLKKRVLLEVTMGQGVVADLGKTILFSDQFSSCSGVFFYNEKTKKGGIYHFASNKYDQLSKLVEFAKRIKPTWIGIDRRLLKANNNVEKQLNEQANEQYDKINEAMLETGAETIEEIEQSQQYSVYISEASDKPIVKPELVTGEASINLTNKEELPEYLKNFAGTDMLHNAEFFNKDFAKDY